MKFLVVLHDAFGGRGGIAKFNRDLLRGLCASPHCERVIALPRVAPIDGVDAVANPISPKLTYQLPPPSGLVRYGFTLLRTLLIEPRFDLLIIGHVRLLPLLHMLKLLPRHKQPRQIGLILHGVEALAPLPLRTSRHLLSKLDWFSAVSHWTSQKFLFWAQIEPSKALVLPNAVDLSRFTPGPPPPNLVARYGLAGKKILMGMGRLDSREKYKGFDEVIEALPELLKTQPELVYMIIGDGPDGFNDRARLQQKAAAMGLRNQVIFTGWIDEASKIDHYRLADVFLLCGWGEGFGIVLIEAMGCGIPSIGSSLDGSIEAVAAQDTVSGHRAKLGWVANPKIPSELQATIMAALAEPRPYVPVGLDYFSETNFDQRVQDLIVARLGDTSSR
ncbi:MAG: glycosyltransferase family 4 protein [Candidatus Symbiobacter sp.]|nr:glycosyltransferase family 4 protein [Candidatus Symbiobacter sp.]